MSEDVVQLVVGLGNPGPGHAGDRHNAGFWCLDALAAKLALGLREDGRCKGEFGRAASGLRLLKPLTYMNLSGEALAACAGYYRIPPAGVLVVHDDLDLPAGSARLKRGGGHGGHNGLRSIERHLGTRDFLRVRLGIGHPGPGGDVTAYVLGSPTPDERVAIVSAIDAVVADIDIIVGGDFERAMNTFNRRRSKREDDS